MRYVGFAKISEREIERDRNRENSSLYSHSNIFLEMFSFESYYQLSCHCGLLQAPID